VRRELCVQADPPPFLAQVEQESTDRAEALDRLGELRSTVAALAAEDIAREAFAVRPHQRWRAAILTAANRGLPVAEPKGKVLTLVNEAIESEQAGRDGEAARGPHRHDYLGPHRCAGQRLVHQSPCSLVLEAGRQCVPQQNHIADLANLGEPRPAVRRPRKLSILDESRSARVANEQRRYHEV